MPPAEESPAPVVAIPPLDDYNYQAQRLIETDSKMSAVLLASTARRRPVVLKIARVDQRVRAEANRQAIQNSVLWLRRLGQREGLVRLYPIAGKAHAKGRTPAPVYSATLPQWPGQPDFLVMEYLAGGSLSDYVDAGPLGIDTVLWIAHYLAQTLAYMHQQGCVHRDMKPENILFRAPPPGSDGSGKHGRQLGRIQPVLVDFGVAAARGERRLVSGSRLWMAPELQEADEQAPLPVDPAWDVYALGLILCYMISGRQPRRRSYEYASVLAYRDHALAVLEQIVQEGSGQATVQGGSSMPSIEARLARLITAMLAKDPARRPEAHEVAAITGALLADLGVTLPWHARLRIQLAGSRSLPLRKRVQLVLAAALVAVVVLGGVANLVFSLPVTVTARGGAERAGPSAPSSTPAPTPLPGTAVPAAGQQQGAFSEQITPAGTLAPEPTRVPFTPPAALALPTLIPFTPATITAAAATAAPASDQVRTDRGH